MSYTPGQYRTFNAARSRVTTTALKPASLSVTLGSGDGAKFPATGPYLVALGATSAPFEVAMVISRSGDTLTVERGEPGGLTPQSWPTGTPVELLQPDGTGDLWGVGALVAIVAAGTVNLKGNTAQTLAAAGTIATAGLGVSRVTSAGDVAGIILAPGTVDGQVCIVQNSGAHTVTFAVAGTSNVSTGTGASIATLTAVPYVWDATAALWYPLV